MRVAIIAAGKIEKYDLVKAHIGRPDLVLCADAGVNHALALGLKPDMVLGDFDSAGPEVADEMATEGISVRRMPVEKDLTDTHLALDEAVRRGATEIVLAGATGGRLDHTICNLILLPGIPEHVAITVVDGNNVLRLLHPGRRLRITGLVGEYLSLLPLTPEVTGVVAEGVKWRLDGVTLRWGESMGVSNQFVVPEAVVSVQSGCLLVIQSWD